jgi:hypothetical protein
MKVNINKLVSILELKTSKAIEKLDSLKCTTVEFRDVLSSIVNNLESIKKIKEFDTECPDCKTQSEVKKENSTLQGVSNQSPTPMEVQPNNNSQQIAATAIGRKWVPYKK